MIKNKSDLSILHNWYLDNFVNAWRKEKGDKKEMKKKLDRAMAVLLAAILVFVNSDVTAIAAVNGTGGENDIMILSEGDVPGDDDVEDSDGEDSKEGEDITNDEFEIIPFGGMSKYYGQNKRLLESEHYTITVSGNDEGSTEKEITEDWSITLKSEKPGEQEFVVSGDTVRLAKDAQTFKILEYYVPAGIEAKIADDKKYVNKNDAETSGCEVTLIAPEGYLISDRCETDSYTWGGNMPYEGKEAEETDAPLWSDSMVFSIADKQDGPVKISYYLRSNRNDSTKGAIDCTERIKEIYKDITEPEIKLQPTPVGGGSVDVDLTSSEAGVYYYMVVPAEETEPDAGEIQKNAKLGIGKSGSGRAGNNSSVTINITGLSTSTQYKIYAVVVDDFGNESKRESAEFTTDLPTIEGEVQILGTVEVGSTLTADTELKSVGVNSLTYQWFRLSLEEDKTSLDEVYDETDDSDEDEDDADNADNAPDETDDEKDDADDKIESPTWSMEDGDAVPIEGATSQTYQITREDIGCRLVVRVGEAENPYVGNTYSGELVGSTTTFVPKLIPAYTLPTVKRIVYSPTNKLSDITLPSGWSWVDGSITPSYGNSGYRAQFVPADTNVYKTAVVSIKVPVTRRELKKNWVKISANTAYAGENIKDNFKITYKKYKLVSGEDYKAAYSKNKKLGKATVKIKGIGNFKGSVTVTYNIVPQSIGKVTCKYAATKVYTGEEVTLSLTMKNNSEKLKKGRDYTVTYNNNVEIGKATATIQGIGNYKGTKKITFSIVPAQPKLTVSKKNSGFIATMSSVHEISGYQLEVSTSRSFTKKKTQTYRVTGTSLGLPVLKKGNYYVRVMSYATKGKKEYKSAYSSIKKVTIK